MCYSRVSCVTVTGNNQQRQSRGSQVFVVCVRLSVKGFCECERPSGGAAATRNNFSKEEETQQQQQLEEESKSETRPSLHPVCSNERTDGSVSKNECCFWELAKIYHPVLHGFFFISVISGAVKQTR